MESRLGVQELDAILELSEQLGGSAGIDRGSQQAESAVTAVPVEPGQLQLLAPVRGLPRSKRRERVTQPARILGKDEMREQRESGGGVVRQAEQGAQRSVALQDLSFEAQPGQADRSVIDRYREPRLATSGTCGWPGHLSDLALPSAGRVRMRGCGRPRQNAA